MVEPVPCPKKDCVGRGPQSRIRNLEGRRRGNGCSSRCCGIAGRESTVHTGKGAVFNTDGKNELEVSIALYKPPASNPNIPLNRLCMSLSLLTGVKNPSKLARAIYVAALREGDPTRSTVSEDHVPESSSAAGDQVPLATTNIVDDGPYADSDSLANQLGFELVDPSYFLTEPRWREHRQGLGLPTEPRPGRPHLTSASAEPPPARIFQRKEQRQDQQASWPDWGYTCYGMWVLGGRHQGIGGGCQTVHIRKPPTARDN
ncbi:hypothetical protein BKA70DRAFT_1215070 [Coprinopsis sp. MPI-PUGE-AT-0042]|nr:hypothetical protein BKA70DRAFT_1215070 [Coprinopsis sp. MPI-PUGE-AT-0042]